MMAIEIREMEQLKLHINIITAALKGWRYPNFRGAENRPAWCLPGAADEPSS